MLQHLNFPDDHCYGDVPTARTDLNNWIMIYRLGNLSDSLRLASSGGSLFSRLRVAAVSGESAEATETSLRSRPGGTRALESTGPSAESQTTGFAARLFSELARLSGEMQRITGALSTTLEGSEQHQAILREQEALSTEYLRITGSETFKQLSELTQQVTQALESGSSGEALARVLKSQRGLLGDQFIGLVQRGDIFRIGQVGSAISGLASMTAEDLDPLLDPGTAVGALANQALNALSGPGYMEKEESDSIPLLESSNEPLPEATVMNFDLPGSSSLQIIAYTGPELMKAVKHDLLPDPRQLVHLIIDSPEDDDDREKDQERNQAVSPLRPLIS